MCPQLEGRHWEAKALRVCFCSLAQGTPASVMRSALRRSRQSSLPEAVLDACSYWRGVPSRAACPLSSREGCARQSQVSQLFRTTAVECQRMQRADRWTPKLIPDRLCPKWVSLAHGHARVPETPLRIRADFLSHRLHLAGRVSQSHVVIDRVRGQV